MVRDGRSREAGSRCRRRRSSSGSELLSSHPPPSFRESPRAHQVEQGWHGRHSDVTAGKMQPNVWEMTSFRGISAVVHFGGANRHERTRKTRKLPPRPPSPISYPLSPPPLPPTSACRVNPTGDDNFRCLGLACSDISHSRSVAGFDGGMNLVRDDSRLWSSSGAFVRISSMEWGGRPWNVLVPVARSVCARVKPVVTVEFGRYTFFSLASDPPRWFEASRSTRPP